MIYLNCLTDGELLRLATAQFDPITGTELEQQLLKRFEEVSADCSHYAPLDEALGDFDLTDPKVVSCLRLAIENARAREKEQATLKVLQDHEIEDPETLRELLDCVSKLVTLTK